MLRVSKPTVWRWIASGRLPARKLGPRSIRVERSVLRRFGQRVRAGRTMTREELEPYILPRPAPTLTEEESMARIEEINQRILARNGGKPLGSSVSLIHEQRR